MPGTLLLLVSNFRGISGELIELATLDGCGYFQMIAKIVVPLGYPTIAILIIFQFMGFWNDLFTPMILLQKMNMRTVMVALSALMDRNQSDPAFLLAGLLLSTAPMLAVYLLFQKQIVKAYDGILPKKSMARRTLESIPQAANRNDANTIRSSACVLYAVYDH